MAKNKSSENETDIIIMLNLQYPNEPSNRIM